MYHQLLVHADDVNVLGGSKRTVEINAEALVINSKEIGLEMNADKTKYMVMSEDQNAGRSHSMETDNSSFERVKEFKCLGTILSNRIYIQEEIKSRLSHGMFAVIRCRMCCLPVCYRKIQRLKYTG